MIEGVKEGIIAMVVVLLLGAGYFYYESHQSQKKAVQQQSRSYIPPMPPMSQKVKSSNELPMLPMTKLDGSRLTAKQLKGKTVLVLFQPDCDHCQREAVQIQEHLDAFKGYTLYFVSDAGLPQISQFAQEYKLAGNPNIHFATTTLQDIINALGPVDAPSLFVYSEQGRLVKSFIGETPIEEILKSL
jgi:thiol-disulfide isomerase/thioredoxin